MSRFSANLLLLLAGAMWGAGFIAQYTAMEAIGPMQFIGFRFIAATIAMLPFALLEAGRAAAPLSPRNWKVFGWIGVILFLEIAAQQYGLRTTTVTNSGFLTGLYVVFTPFVAILLYRSPPHPVVWPAAFAAFCGIWMLSGGDVGALTRGDWLTILSAVLISLSLVMIQRHAAGTGRPVTLAVTQFAVCAVVGTILGLLIEPFDSAALARALPEILYSGIVSGGIAFTLQAVGQRYTTASQAAIFLSSEAVFAALFAALFLEERLGPLGLAGCALIMVAIIAVEALPPFLRPQRSEG